MFLKNVRYKDLSEASNEVINEIRIHILNNNAPRWKRGIKMMKVFFPGLICRRLPETNRMVFQVFPFNEQDISVWNFKTLSVIDGPAILS